MGEDNFQHTNESELDQLIDRYLIGKLSPAEKKDFEEKLLSDPELKQRVSTQRWMMSELGDREKMAFINQLFTISEELKTEQEQPAKVRELFRSPLSWMAAAAAIILLLILVIRPKQENISAPIALEQSDSIPDSGADLAQNKEDSIQPVPEETSQPVPPPSPPPKKLIAAADPADFSPNPYLDPLVNRNIRSDEPSFSGNMSYEIQSKRLTLQGEITELATSSESWGVFLYSNREEDYLEGSTLLKEPLALVADDTIEGKFTFEETYTINLKPGRYYYFFAEFEEEEPIRVETFVVDPN